MTNLLFVYGSLICKESRNYTSNVSCWVPGVLKWYKRWWYFQMKECSMSALAIIKDKNYSCNGVLLEVDDEQLLSFDRRENGYHRVEILKCELDWLESCYNKKIWTYIVDKQNIPNEKFPIVQSYVDVIIDWCMAYWSEFTDEFINSTYWWDWEWINDRDNPRCKRRLKNPCIESIENILRSNKLK